MLKWAMPCSAMVVSFGLVLTVGLPFTDKVAPVEVESVWTPVRLLRTRQVKLTPLSVKGMFERDKVAVVAPEYAGEEPPLEMSTPLRFH